MPAKPSTKPYRIRAGRLELLAGADEYFAAGGALDLRMPAPGARPDGASLCELPPGLKVRRVCCQDYPDLVELPAGWECRRLEMVNTGLRTLPADLNVSERLNLSGSKIESLPAGLKVSYLSLRNCDRLTALPEGLEVDYLDITGCTGLEAWPASARVRVGHLLARGCAKLARLPAGLGPLSQVDVADCPALTALPADLEIGSWLDVGGSGIRELPESLLGVPLRWRGVPIDARIAFRPGSITAAETLAEANAEVRRVMMERMGLERFLAEAAAETVDADTDPGGIRKLLRVKMEGDEDLVCLMVRCPSTARQYMLRVPPGTPTCRHAAAWIAGFDNPNDYRPVLET